MHAIVIHEGAAVTAFSRIEGPCVIGPFTQIMGAKVRGGVTFGPHCRIGGDQGRARLRHGLVFRLRRGLVFRLHATQAFVSRAR